jgi:hypothetical protein
VNPGGGLPSLEMSNVLNETKKQQAIALGRLGWSLRRIQNETGIRRETIASYLRAVGIEVRSLGRWGRPKISNPANQVTPDSKPAMEVTPDSGASSPPGGGSIPSGAASACEPFRETIAAGLSRGRNAKAI